jgi:hypothetical protein
MKSSILMTLFLGIFICAPIFAESSPTPLNLDQIELGIGLLPGGLAGPMADNLDNLLTPTPSEIQLGDVLASATFYFIPELGLEVLGHLGTIQATAKGTKPLNAIDSQTFLAGPVVRAIWVLTPRTNLDFTLSGGFQATSMQWDSDFTSLLASSMPSGYVLASFKTAPSYYGKFGVIYRDGFLFASFSILYEKLSVTLSNGNDLSADCWSVPLQVGLAF